VVFAKASKSGQKTIQASDLVPGAKYIVNMQDNRQQAYDKLDSKQQQEVQDHFNKLDADGSQSISRDEIETSVKERTVAHVTKLEEQCAAFIAANPSAQGAAEANLALAVEKLKGAEVRVLETFEKADLDGNGVLTWDEFKLAEAWWITSSVNPDKVNLF